MSTIYMKQSDTSPLPWCTLTGADGATQDLTGCTIECNIGKGSTVIVSHGTTEVDDDPTTGKVRFADWSQADAPAFAAMAGDYRLEFEVTFGDGTTLSFPNSDYVTLHVTKDVA